ENNTLMLHRWQENNHILCFLNFSAKTVTTKFFSDKTGWQMLINSASPVWKGNYETPPSVKNINEILITGESILIYKNSDI
ncbi:MAG: malto-oligosyltrehalose trehalohydrolase, partial [Chitinophagaceae bacterium]